MTGHVAAPRRTMIDSLAARFGDALVATRRCYSYCGRWRSGSQSRATRVGLCVWLGSPARVELQTRRASFLAHARSSIEGGSGGGSGGCLSSRVCKCTHSCAHSPHLWNTPARHQASTMSSWPCGRAASSSASRGVAHPAGGHPHCVVRAIGELVLQLLLLPSSCLFRLLLWPFEHCSVVGLCSCGCLLEVRPTRGKGIITSKGWRFFYSHPIRLVVFYSHPIK